MTEKDLFKHGFNGGRNLHHPLKNNIELLRYIFYSFLRIRTLDFNI